MSQQPLAFLIPGDITRPTGGYAYDREVLSQLTAHGYAPHHVALPASFPFPTLDSIITTLKLISDLPSDMPLLIDGLAFGAFDNALLSQLAPRPLIALVHHPLGLETGLSVEQSKALIISERHALTYADHIVVTGQATATILRSDFGVSDKPITVAEPGVTPVTLSPYRTPPQQLLSVGSIIPRKGYDVLVRALSALSHLKWQLTIVGAIDLATDTYENLKKLIEEHHLEERITFTGALEAHVLENIYQYADIFICASHFEGYGMVITEALAHGLPVIATPTGVGTDPRFQQEIVTVPSNDASALQIAIEKMLKNEPFRLMMRRQIETIATQLTTWNDTARHIAHAVTTTLKGRVI